MSHASNTGANEHTIKETIISLLISFVMALVFRSYVVEAFVIPTGSMAPTLMGKHTLHRSEHTGYEWAMNPTHFADAGQRIPLPVQGGTYGRFANPQIMATDPMTTNGFNTSSDASRRRNGLSTQASSEPLLAGDRILVQKYLYEIFPPTRYDVVVFKNPTNPLENYIKRLIGLPNEQVLIAEGDIFARPLDASGEPTRQAYEIQRKPVRVMSDLWRPLFSSEYTPRTESPAFRFPWLTGAGWSREGGVLTHDGSGPTTLAWDAINWPIWDWEPYNESVRGVNSDLSPIYPVGDVRARAGVEPTGDGLDLSCTVSTREHEFRATIIGTSATISVRRAGTGITPGEWSTLASEEIRALPSGVVTNVEFWHYDQRLILKAGGKTVAQAEYDWDASERLLNTTGEPITSFERAGLRDMRLVAAQTYTRAQTDVAWAFSGGGVRLHRVGLDRDIYHRPSGLEHSRGSLGHGTHPLTAIKLGADQFWCLGDNSPASLDGRAWDDVDPRVAELIDSTPGVVPRKLMLGKAFFVYFPAIHKLFDKFPIPNAGKLRLIR